MSTTSAEAAAIVANIQDVRATIDAESPPGTACTLVAVSKLKPASAVEAAVSGTGSSQLDFGENFVDELYAKASEINRLGTHPQVQWHLVGELVDDEIEMLVQCPGLYLVHSCPSVRSAKLLDAACAKHRTAPLGILLQIATGGSEQSGIAPADAPTAAVAVRGSCSAVELRGVMCVGQYGQDSTVHYQQLLAVREAVGAALGVEASSLFLSMGMSEDFAAAVRLGATHVRVGSTIFGARNGRL